MSVCAECHGKGSIELLVGVPPPPFRADGGRSPAPCDSHRLKIDVGLRQSEVKLLRKDILTTDPLPTGQYQEMVYKMISQYRPAT
jgi:hypothetical protein